jgi:hypothetical protein
MKGGSNPPNPPNPVITVANNNQNPPQNPPPNAQNPNLLQVPINLQQPEHAPGQQQPGQQHQGQQQPAAKSTIRK